MRTTASRRNERLLQAINAVALAAITWFALSEMLFEPTNAAMVFAVAVGLIALFSPEGATATFVVAAALPVFAASALGGMIFLVAGLMMVSYLGGDEVPVLVFVAAAFAAAALGPVWAVPVLVGYVLGGSRGAFASAVTCAILEVAGIVLGRSGFGVVFVGASRPLFVFADNPENLLKFAWFIPSLKAMSTAGATALWTTASDVRSSAILALQPAAWAAAAFVAGRMRRPSGDKQQLVMGLGAASAGVAIAAAGSIAALAALGLNPAYSRMVTSVLTSLVVAGAVTLLWDRAFKVKPVAAQVAAQVAAPTQRNMAEEDADVDELLRMIATAEDRIASQHTTEAVVMITDMKSFSRMTEEEGSFVTAKAIQRHRDLLLPVIETHGGKGKSTGGDGLIASFATSGDALCAAIDMQKKLAMYNAEHQRERDILIRVGIASGEVVLDKGGRPFIGNALNLSARVMSLGDGGQVLATREVVAAAKGAALSTFSHGEFELKNIAHPVEVLEVLWQEGQSPCDPRTLGAASAEAPKDNSPAEEG